MQAKKSPVASNVALLHHKLHTRFKLNTYRCIWFKSSVCETIIFVQTIFKIKNIKNLKDENTKKNFDENSS